MPLQFSLPLRVHGGGSQFPSDMGLKPPTGVIKGVQCEASCSWLASSTWWVGGNKPP